MSNCKFITTCPFFTGRMDDSKGLGAMYKKHYCLGSSKNCARYIIASKLGKEKMPANLYPHQKDRAIQLLDDNEDVNSMTG